MTERTSLFPGPDHSQWSTWTLDLVGCPAIPGLGSAPPQEDPSRLWGNGNGLLLSESRVLHPSTLQGSVNLLFPRKPCGGRILGLNGVGQTAQAGLEPALL